MNPAPTARRNAFASVILAALACMGADVLACNVPVFRYALERWPAGNYNAVVFHRGLNPFDQTRISGWNSTAKSSGANIQFRDVNVAGNLSPAEAALWKSQSNAALPWVAIRLPDSDPEDPAFWAGSLSTLEIGALIKSPARTAIADRLASGDSAVWVLVASGDSGQDEAAATLLTNELRRLEGVLKLPPSAPDDPTPRSTLPLRIKFSILRVNRTPEEDLFVKMLLHDEEVTPGKPVVAPVFGRARALAILSGFELSPKTFSQAAGFLCGACSCEVKELNPGKDLLVARDWESMFAGLPPEPKSPQAGEAVRIAPGNSATPKAAPVHVPDQRRGLKMLASTALAFGSILLLVVGIVLVRSLRVK